MFRFGNKKINQYYILIFILYLFFAQAVINNRLPLIGYADELIAAMAIPIFLVRRKIDRLSLLWPVAGYMLVGLISSLVYEYQPHAAILADGLVCVKMWMAIYVGREIFRGFDVEVYAKKIYNHVRLFTVVSFVLLILASIFDFWVAEYRYGIKGIFLYGTNGSVMASYYAVMTMILLMISPYVKRAYIYLGMLMILLVMTVRSKAIAIAFCAGFLYVYIIKLNKKITLMQLAILGIAAMILGAPMIGFYYFGVGSDQLNSPRAMLTKRSIEIANEHFPLGAGFGAFASDYSGKNYSQLYQKYKLSHIEGLRDKNPMYLSDTFWPIIIGQFGWIGLAFFLLALIVLVIKAQSVKDKGRGYYAAGWLFILATLINSIAEPAYVNGVIVSYAVVMGLVLADEKNSIAQNIE